MKIRHNVRDQLSRRQFNQPGDQTSDSWTTVITDNLPIEIIRRALSQKLNIYHCHKILLLDE